MSDPASKPKTFSITWVSEHFKVALRTLRYWDACGLLLPSYSGKGRVYSEQDCQRIDLILKAKRMFFTPGQISKMIVEDGTGKLSLKIDKETFLRQSGIIERKKCAAQNAYDELQGIYSLSGKT